MKSFKAAILGSLVGGSLLLLSVPSQAAPWGGRFNHRTLGNDLRNDRAEIQGERRDLYNDHREAAGSMRTIRYCIPCRDFCGDWQNEARGRVTGKPHRYAFLSQAIMKHQRRLSVLIDVCCSELG